MNGRIPTERWIPRKGAGEGSPDGMGAGSLVLGASRPRIKLLAAKGFATGGLVGSTNGHRLNRFQGEQGGFP